MQFYVLVRNILEPDTNRITNFTTIFDKKKSWLKVDSGKGFAQPNISQGGYMYKTRHYGVATKSRTGMPSLASRTRPRNNPIAAASRTRPTNNPIAAAASHKQRPVDQSTNDPYAAPARIGQGSTPTPTHSSRRPRFPDDTARANHCRRKSLPAQIIACANHCPRKHSYEERQSAVTWNRLVCIFAQDYLVLHNDVNCHWFYFCLYILSTIL
jgi:hypothetical protein